MDKQTSLRIIDSFKWTARLILAVMLASASVAPAQEIKNPLKPPDTSSPRATVESFVENINNLYRVIKQQAGEGDKKGQQANELKQGIFEKRAVQCLDLSKLNPDVAASVGKERAILLSEILDRIGVPKDIPDLKDEGVKKNKKWRIPNTEITVAQVEKGPREGEFLFSADTVERIPQFYQMVKQLPYLPSTVLKEAHKKLTTTEVSAPKKPSLLRPPDTSSPQATLNTFLDNMKIVYKGLREYGISKESVARLRNDWSRAIKCLDLSGIAPSLVERIGTEKAVLLMEIADRLELPSIEQVPTAKEMAREKLTSWSIPGTEIKIARVEKGPHQGQYLFTNETVANLEDYYDRVRHLPYKDSAILRNVHSLYLHAPGWMIPSSWINALPQWTKTLVFNQPLWKWGAILAVGILLVVLLVYAYRFGSRKSADDPQPSLWRHFLFPVSAIALPLVLGQFVIYQIRPSGGITPYIQTMIVIIVFIAIALLVLMASNAAANSIIRARRIGARGANAHMVRITFRLLSLAALVALILWASYELGVPLTPVLAGLGVGGVAIALAAQNSVENLIGGLNLFADRPVRVGDFCRFGSNVGTVEEIGLRSTRIRTLDDSVISVPNAAFSKHELENLSKRTKIRYCPRIAIRVETTPDQIRYILVEAQKLLCAHPMVLSEPARIRFSGFGEGCLYLDVFAYVNVTDYSAFLEVAEDLNLRIMEVISQAGSDLAAPARLSYREGLNEERAKEAVKQVNVWREENALYLPRLPEELVAEMRNSLEYPPKGSPQTYKDNIS